MKITPENIATLKADEVVIVAYYERNLALAKRAMDEHFNDVHSGDLTTEKCDLARLQITQTKSIFTNAKNQDIDYGIGGLVGVSNITIKRKYDELTAYYNQAIIELDGYLSVIDDMIKYKAIAMENEAIVFNADQLQSHVLKLAENGFIKATQTELLAQQLTTKTPDLNKPKVQWLASNPQLLYYMTRLFKDGKKHVAFCKKVFKTGKPIADNQLKATQGFSEIDQLFADN